MADAINHRIRRLIANVVTTYARSGAEDTTSGQGSAAAFEHPIQLTADTAGYLYIIDVEDFRVRKISSSAILSVVAGNGERGFADGSVANTEFEKPQALLQMTRETFTYQIINKRIRKISAAGLVTTIAGNGKAAYVNGKADKA